MRAYVGALVLAAVVAGILTPVVRRFALWIGAVDLPGGRKIHEHSTPRLGGVAIYLAFTGPIVSLFFLASNVADALRANSKMAAAVLIGGLAMCALGFVDDLHGIRALYKLYGHIAVAVFAFVGGFRIDAISVPIVGSLQMGAFSLPVTVFWIVGIINAVNLIDGLDGLAGGVVFFAALTNFVVAYISGSIFVALFMASMLGAVVGFLFYNFNPARIFMGDSGSYFLGYVLATISVVGASQKASTTVSLLVPVIALGVPIFDTLFAMVRRFLERRPIFSPDRGHIHHRLLDMGITQRKAVLILYGVSVIFTVSAIAVSLGRNWQIGVAILGASVVLVGLVRFVGYFEYLHLRKRQKARIRSRHSELLRRIVPGMASVLDATKDKEGFFATIEHFGAGAELVLIAIMRKQGVGEEKIWIWENLDTASRGGGKTVSSRYPIGYECEIKFAWNSELHEVSPQVDILLQVIADLIQARLESSQGRWLGDGTSAQEIQSSSIVAASSAFE
jgi:UDP-GlcNAc:undecaprenyl-phosphate GlcNAc-1-phosphate transferase